METLKQELEVTTDVQNDNENHAVGMDIADRVDCCICGEYSRITDMNFRNQVKICDSCFSNYESQSKSEWIENKNEWYKSCIDCMIRFSDNLEMFKHTCTCHNLFMCSECQILHDRKIDIVKHLRNFNQFNWHNSVTTLSTNMKANSLHCTVKKHFTCNICDKSFTLAGTLNRHLILHSGKKPFTCNRCNKSFTQAGSLKTHLLIHSGKKPYICNQCDKSFSQAGHLKNHYSLQRNASFFSISWYCFEEQYKKSIPGILSIANSYNCSGVTIWLLYGLRKLALAAIRLTLPLSPSHALLPCDVAKNCHSASIPKSTL